LARFKAGAYSVVKTDRKAKNIEAEITT